MGSSWCGQTTIELPEYSAEFGSSDLPAWVSAGGRALFDQAVGLAGSTPGPSNIDKLASYGPEGNLLTEDEQLAAQILREGAGSYQPFLEKTCLAVTKVHLEKTCLVVVLASTQLSLI